MTASVADYQQMAASLPDEVFLGTIAFTSVPDNLYSLADIQKALASVGLPAYPKEVRRIDAFKRATKEIVQKWRLTDEWREINVLEVGADTQESHRAVVLDRGVFKVGQRKRVERENLFFIHYDRGRKVKVGKDVNGKDQFVIMDDDIVVEQRVPDAILEEVLRPEELAHVRSFLAEDGAGLKARFNAHADTLNSHGVRAYLRDFIYQHSGINLKAASGGSGGGVYFVRQSYTDDMRALAEFTNKIGCYCHLFPLIDIVDQRDMLAEAFIEDTLDEVRSEMAEIKKIMESGRSIRDDTWQAFKDRHDDLKIRTKEFTNLLDRNLDKADFQLQAFDYAITNLSGRIKGGPLRLNTP